MNVKLSLQESTSIPSLAQSTAKETTSIRSSLLTLGLSTPAITPDMLAKDQEYHRELAGELEGVLQGVMGDGRGVVGLDEVWCLWNRARGVCKSAPVNLVALSLSLSRNLLISLSDFRERKSTS